MKNKGWRGEPVRHGLSAKGIKNAQNEPNIIPYRQLKKKKTAIPDFVNNGVLTEQEIKLLKRRLNDKKITQEDIFGEDFDKFFRITDTQTRKGLDYLENIRRTPSGAERKNNPFGAREERILDNFSHFELKEFQNVGNAYFDRYTELWEVVSKDGSTFEYYLGSSGSSPITITG